MTLEQTALQPTDDDCDYEADWIKSALESKTEAEAEWRRRRQTFAIVHPEPTYVSAADWHLYADIPDPEAPCDRVIRFDLIGGGQIKSVEHFVPWPDSGISKKVICYRTIFTSPLISATLSSERTVKRRRQSARTLRDQLLCRGVSTRHRSRNR